MLMLVNLYGLSHVCAFDEFENIGVLTRPNDYPYNFPYLDIYFPDPRKSAIEFYYRGARDRNLKFKNLFEYMLWNSLNGQGFTRLALLLYKFKKLFTDSHGLFSCRKLYKISHLVVLFCFCKILFSLFF